MKPTIWRVALGIACCAAVAVAAIGISAAQGGASPNKSTGPATAKQASGPSATHHYLYVFPDGQMFVYDMDRGHRLVQHVSLPGIEGIRGVAASPRTGTLYISHGGDGGGNGSGSLAAFDLRSSRMLWDRSYSFGIDSMAITPDGQRIYMPDGELAQNGRWMVLDAHNGAVLGAIQGGAGAHNTIVSLDGRRVYLGGRNYPYLNVARTATRRLVKRAGPLRGGVRPFTINGRQTFAFTTASYFLGFQISSLRTGRVLYTETPGARFGWDPSTYRHSAPSHGISLSPGERRIWVIDGPNSYVHVFDVSSLPHRPRRVADIHLQHPLTGTERGCAYDCGREGWLLHSMSGCLVYVGDSGDVLSAVTLRPVAYVPALRETRKYLEIDWTGSTPVSTTTRSGLGYVTAGRHPRPRCP